MTIPPVLPSLGLPSKITTMFLFVTATWKTYLGWSSLLASVPRPRAIASEKQPLSLSNARNRQRSPPSVGQALPLLPLIRLPVRQSAHSPLRDRRNVSVRLRPPNPSIPRPNQPTRLAILIHRRTQNIRSIYSRNGSLASRPENRTSSSRQIPLGITNGLSSRASG